MKLFNESRSSDKLNTAIYTYTIIIWQLFLIYIFKIKNIIFLVDLYKYSSTIHVSLQQINRFEIKIKMLQIFLNGYLIGFRYASTKVYYSRFVYPGRRVMEFSMLCTPYTPRVCSLVMTEIKSRNRSNIYAFALSDTRCLER